MDSSNEQLQQRLIGGDPKLIHNAMTEQTASPSIRRKILLVEDSRPLRIILTGELRSGPGWELVDSADTAAGAILAFELYRPAFVLLDLVLREGRGLDVLRAVKRRAPQCQVWIFTAHDGDPFRDRCLAAGADRFFSKLTQSKLLTQQLRQVGGGGRD